MILKKSTLLAREEIGQKEAKIKKGRRKALKFLQYAPVVG